MFTVLFEDREPPEFSFIGWTAKKVDGPERLAQLLWMASAYRPTGDPLKYCLGLARGATPPAEESDVIEVKVI